MSRRGRRPRSGTASPDRGRRRIARRVWALAVLTPTLLLLSTSRAVADSDVSRPAAALSWMDLRDSRGISIWDYDLSLDRGGITNPLKLVWSVFADIGWHVYTWLVGSAMWLIDFTLSFGWLEPFEGPAEAVSDSLADVISRFGALPVILTLAGVVAAVLVMAGRFATGLYEFFAAATVAALAVGVLASPVHYLTGGDSWLMQARDLGLEVGGSLSADGSQRAAPEPDEIREDMSHQLADIFIRAPHQLVNYNAVIDGTECEDAYDTGLRVSNAHWERTTVDGMPGWKLIDPATGDPVKLPDGMTLADAFGIAGDKVGFRAMAGDVPEQRSVVENCDPALGDAAANPSFTQVINTLALGVGGIFLALLALALCLAVWASAIYALILAVKALWNLITGILPGGQRLGLTRTIAEVLIALIVVLAAVVFLMAYLQVVTAVFHSTDGPPMKRFAILDLLLIGGLIVWLRMRKALKRAAAQLAEKMAARPRSKPTKIGAGFGPAQQWASARRIGSQARRAGQGTMTAGHGVVVAGRQSGKAVGAGAFGAFAGTVGAVKGGRWLADRARNSPRLQPVMAGDETATDAPGAEASSNAPPGTGGATAVPGRGPDGRPPRHSAASLARRQAIQHRLASASRSARDPRTVRPGVSPHDPVPREPARRPVPRPAPRDPVPREPAPVPRPGRPPERVPSGPDVHRVTRRRTGDTEAPKPTRMPL